MDQNVDSLCQSTKFPFGNIIFNRSDHHSDDPPPLRLYSFVSFHVYTKLLSLFQQSCTIDLSLQCLIPTALRRHCSPVDTDLENELECKTQ